MAINDSTLVDEDGEFSDWIEIQNIGDMALDLAGWRLTDDAADLTKWTFPSRTLTVGERMIVFASSKDRTDAGELHTNFNLSGNGEYLALLSPGGNTIVSQYDPYPPQFDDVSYGAGSEVVGNPLLQLGDDIRALVPTSNALGNTWTGDPANEPFDDSTWLAGSSGVGFDLGGPAAPPQQVIGHPPTNRSSAESAVGNITMLESQRFTDAGVVTSWTVYSDAGGEITPLLLRADEFGEYEISGIGTTRTLSGGTETFAFAPQSGTANVAADIVFAWKDGGIGSDSAGVPDMTNGTGDSVRRFGQHTTFAVGDNLGVGQALNRTYSINATATIASSLAPVAYWSFDGQATDETGGGSNGDIRGATFDNQSPSQIGSGQSLSFDGTSDYVSVPIDVPETNYSSSLWFKTTSTSRGLFAVVANDLGSGGHDRHIYLNGGNIAARTWSNETITSSGQNYADGQWHFVVHVVGAAVNGQRIYVDGQLVASGSKAGSDFDWQQHVNIGFSNDAANDYFQGQIDDVAIWPTVLDTDQIQSLYQGSSPIALAGYQPWIGLNVEAAMAGRTSAYVRSSFDVPDPSALDALELSIRYDDGFVAYLNGVEIARRNAPASVSYTSTATSERRRVDAIRPETIDVPLPAGLVQTSGNVLAIHLLAESSDDDELLLVPEAFGLRTIGDRYLEPTPGQGNGHGVLGFLTAPTITVPHGFYDQTFTTAITPSTPGASVYYTVDGSQPDPTNPAASLYSGPLTISGTTTLRAGSFLADHEPSPVSTASYLFLADIAQQPSLPAGYPSTWNGAGADYAVDPDVINNTLPGYSFNEAVLALPTVSIVTEFENLWSSSTGIYVNSNQRGPAWEREASIELIFPDGSNSLQLDAGIRMHGNSSRHHGFTPKHPIRLHFRGDYGPTKLDFPLFADADYNSFDQILLRPSSTDSWPVTNGNFVQGVQRWHPDHASYIRDQWMRDAQNEMGWPSPHGTYVHLFLNGLYWGQYNIAERPTDDFQSSNFGGEPEDYDIIKDFAELQSGTKDAWNQLFSLAGAGLASEAAYQQIQGNNPDGTPNEDYPVLLDVDALMDYMILHIYSGGEDWPDHNYWAARRRGPESEGFKFFVWDQEISNDSLVREYTRISTRFEDPIGGQNPSYLYGRLMQNETWANKFRDRVHELLFNDGLLTPENNDARWMVRQTEIDQSIVAESARWGDTRRSNPYTREGDWLTEMNWMRDTYWPQIHSIALERFKRVGLYPQVDAPTFSQHGGQLSFGDPLTITATAGDIYYTLDGTDPREPGATLYTGAIAINDSVEVKARALVGGEWSALTVASFQVFTPASAANLTVSEINYHAHEPNTAELAIDPDFEGDDFDFLELRNTSGETIDLHNVDFSDGISFNFSGSNVTTLAPGAFVIVVENLAAFEARYGTGLPVAGVYGGGLNNSDDHLTLVDRFDTVIRDFSYFDNGAWPGRADGDGSSLETIGSTGDLNLATSWRASSEYGGSPGLAGTGAEGEVIINEVLTHTDLPLTDYIEIYNTTGGPIEIGGWVISDSTSNYDKYRIPAGVTLGVGDYLTFDESDFNPGLGTLPRDFALSSTRGESLTLMETDAAGKLLRFVDVVSFTAAANGEAWGRWPNAVGELYPMVSRTPNAANSGPRVGPVIISEVMYHPPGDPALTEHLQYVELINAGSSAVDMTHWSVEGLGSFAFPEQFMLDPAEVVLIVPFDPTDPQFAAELNDFRTTYNLAANVQLIGGFSGQLDNAGERISLYRNDDPPVEEPEFYPQLLEDRITYEPTAPWPSDADGLGDSLTRLACGNWGDDPASWQAATPTPGQASCASVVGRHVFYNDSAFDGGAGANAADDLAIAPGKIALLPGAGPATFANYTSSAGGITGVMIDIAGLPTSYAIDQAEDFTFRVGNANDLSTWRELDESQLPQLGIRVGAGVAGGDRVSLIWPAGSIVGQWLEVRVKATPNTGLAVDDVFYFGNAPGEVSGDNDGTTEVNATDLMAVRQNLTNFLNPAALGNRYDFNHDARVNATDMLVVRDFATRLGNSLQLITIAPAANKTGDIAEQIVVNLSEEKSKSRAEDRTASKAVSFVPLEAESVNFDALFAEMVSFADHDDSSIDWLTDPEAEETLALEVMLEDAS